MNQLKTCVYNPSGLPYQGAPVSFSCFCRYDTTGSHPEKRRHIYSHTAVRGSEWATHKHKPALPAVDDDGRLQPVAEAACTWPANVFGSFDFFLSGERCAQRGRRTCRPAADSKDRTADHFLFPPGRGGRGHLAPHVVSGGREIFSCAIFELPCGYFSRLCFGAALRASGS